MDGRLLYEVLSPKTEKYDANSYSIIILNYCKIVL